MPARPNALPPPSRRLSQHFLTDQQLVTRIIHHVVCEPDAWCLEIGPGDGALTEPLARGVARLMAVELDARRAERLQAYFAAQEHVRIIHGDILRFEPPAGVPLVVVGAIPYHITTPIVQRLEDWAPQLRRAYLIMQREVAQRIAAIPGTKAWGRLSCMVQYRFEVRHCLDLPPEAFRPRPQVASHMVELIPRRTAPCVVHDETFFFALIAQIFCTRRKTLWNSVRAWPRLHIPEPTLRQCLDALGMAPTIRGETLSLSDLARLANALVQMGVPFT